MTIQKRLPEKVMDALRTGNAEIVSAYLSKENPHPLVLTEIARLLRHPVAGQSCWLKFKHRRGRPSQKGRNKKEGAMDALRTGNAAFISAYLLEEKPDPQVLAAIGNLLCPPIAGQSCWLEFEHRKGRPRRNEEYFFLLGLQVSYAKWQFVKLDAALHHVAQKQAISRSTVRAAWDNFQQEMRSQASKANAKRTP